MKLNNESGIPLYVLVLPPNSDGTPNHYSGYYRGRTWIKGISEDIMSKNEAIRFSKATGAKYALFKFIPIEEISKWREIYDNPDPTPTVDNTTYQQQTSMMTKKGFDWLEATGGERSSDAVKKVFATFLEKYY